MAKDAVFTMKIEPELRDKFMEEAERLDRSASQVVREMMREFVHKQEEEREYDKWFREQVEEGIREADDPNTVFISQEEMEGPVRDALIAKLAKLSKLTGDEG